MYDIFAKYNATPGPTTVGGGEGKTTERRTGKGGREKVNCLGRALGPGGVIGRVVLSHTVFLAGPEAGN